MLKKWKPLFISLAVFGCLYSGEVEARKTKILWSDIQLGATRFRPSENTWDSSVTFQGAWTPILDMGNMQIRGEVGVAWPSDSSGYRFLSFNFGGYLMVPVYSLLSLEAGGGLQTWRTGGSGTYPLLGANCVLRVGEFIDRVFFGYSQYLIPGNTVQQFGSGIAINLF